MSVEAAITHLTAAKAELVNNDPPNLIAVRGHLSRARAEIAATNDSMWDDILQQLDDWLAALEWAINELIDAIDEWLSNLGQ